jgi:hypothetical protein
MDIQAEVNARVAQALGDAMIRNIALQVNNEALQAEKARMQQPLDKSNVVYSQKMDQPPREDRK